MEQTPSSPQPTEPPPPLPPPQSQPQQPSSSLPPPSPSGLPSLNPNLNPNPNPSQNPNPNPTPKTLTPVQQQSQFSQPRPPFNRPWQPQSSPFSHFGSLPSPSSSSPAAASSSSTSPSPSVSLPPPPRGGIAIGVPAHHPSPAPPQSTSFSSLNSPSFGQQFGGLGRSSVNVPDSVASSSPSQVRQPIQGYQSMGTMGSMGSGSQMRPGGVPTHQQLRPVQPSLRPQSTPNNQSSATQNFQGQSLLRVSSVGSPSPSSPAPNSPQGMQSHNQPWLSSGSHGKPPLPTSGYRPQLTPQSLQQRSHIPQQHHHSLPTASQQQQTSSSQQSQQPLPSHQQQEPYGQHFPPSRVPALPHQPQIRVQGVGNQKPSSLATVQPSAIQSGPQAKTASPEIGETCNRILSKRSIQELVSQIDPTEKLDPDVEDILVDIADDFVESITTFGCSLAKLRKSSTLEAKDILLHLERNWNLSLPGFSGDEIKNYKKPITNDIHKERLAAIKKSIGGTETANTKSSAGQAAGNAKGHLAKAPASAMDS